VDGVPGLVMVHSATYHHGRDLDGDSGEVHAGIYSVTHGYTQLTLIHTQATQLTPIHTQAIILHGMHLGIVCHIIRLTGGD